MKARHTPPDRSQDRYGNEPSFEWERAEEIVHARLANDDDVSAMLCDVFACTVANRTNGSELTRQLANRQAMLLELFRAKDWIAFGEQLALAMIEDTLATADEIAADEWAGNRNCFDPSARAA